MNYSFNSTEMFISSLMENLPYNFTEKEKDLAILLRVDGNYRQLSFNLINREIEKHICKIFIRLCTIFVLIW